MDPAFSKSKKAAATPPPDVEKVRHKNNFDFLRLIAALAVIIHHSYSLIGRPESLEPTTWLNRELDLGFIGLRIFFVISGYLIAQSLIRSQSVAEYLSKRILRIVPGLIVAVGFCIFIIGPLLTQFSLGRYFRDAHTWEYFVNVSIYYLQFDLPGVIEYSGPNGELMHGAVNGSLWTLMYEFTFYLVLLAFSLAGGLKNRWYPVVFFGALYALRWYFHFYPEWYEYPEHVPFTNLSYKPLLDFGLCFFGGTALTSFKKELRYSIWTALGALAVFLICARTDYFFMAGYLAVPVLLMSVAMAPGFRFLNNAGKYGDFSYGLYIYAWPVQQCIPFFTGGRVTLGWMMAFSILFTLPFAALSWHLIEKPALNLKKYFEKKR